MSLTQQYATLHISFNLRWAGFEKINSGKKYMLCILNRNHTSL